MLPFAHEVDIGGQHAITPEPACQQPCSHFKLLCLSPSDAQSLRLQGAFRLCSRKALGRGLQLHQRFLWATL
jgi:hypothetical protein